MLCLFKSAAEPIESTRNCEVPSRIIWGEGALIVPGIPTKRPSKLVEKERVGPQSGTA